MQQRDQTFSIWAQDDALMTHCNVAVLLFHQSAWSLRRFLPGNISSRFIFLRAGQLMCKDFKQGCAEHAPSTSSAFHFTHWSL